VGNASFQQMKMTRLVRGSINSFGLMRVTE